MDDRVARLLSDMDSQRFASYCRSASSNLASQRCGLHPARRPPGTERHGGHGLELVFGQVPQRPVADGEVEIRVEYAGFERTNLQPQQGTNSAVNCRGNDECCRLRLQCRLLRT